MIARRHIHAWRLVEESAYEAYARMCAAGYGTTTARPQKLKRTCDCGLKQEAIKLPLLDTLPRSLWSYADLEWF